ncbi:hypothetical protein MHBO_000636 [Bonamia ostreae]|uniref:Uncharacterized protein n=1 Tax=Bonamia ostreae TaxID=126728 RepID=A0ABV2AGC3_9EUKA
MALQNYEEANQMARIVISVDRVSRKLRCQLYLRTEESFFGMPEEIGRVNIEDNEPLKPLKQILNEYQEKGKPQQIVNEYNILDNFMEPFNDHERNNDYSLYKNYLNSLGTDPMGVYDDHF